jgi:hypothetical protein
VIRLIATLLLLAVAVGCGRSQDEEAAAARQLVEAFLSEARSGEADRGWEYLSPVTQDALFGADIEAYRQAADAAQWRGFELEVIKVERDEPGLYQVVIRPVDDLPEFVDRFTSWEDGLLTGGPTFMVRFIDITGPPRIHQR